MNSGVSEEEGSQSSFQWFWKYNPAELLGDKLHCLYFQQNGLGDLCSE